MQKSTFLRFSLLILLSALNFLLFSQSINGLIAHYPMDGDATDISPSGNSGIEFNTTSSTNRFGIENSSIFFNGFDSYIQVPDSEDLRLSGSFTISFWVRVEEYSDPIAHTILSKRTGAGNQGYLLTVTGTNHPLDFPEATTSLIVSGGSDPFLLSQNTIAENQWVNVIFDYDNAGTARVFLNNIITGETTGMNTPSFDVLTDLKIGRDDQNQNSTLHFYGDIDDMRIYNRVLNDEEREELLNEGTLNGIVSLSANVSCFGGDDGQLDFIASGGSLNYEYSINDGENFASNPSFQNLNAGTYECVIRDVNLGTTFDLGSISISEPSQIMGNVSQISNSITVSVTGGTPPYTYSIDGENFQTSENFADLEVGTYEIFVNDSNGCLVSITSVDVISSIRDVSKSFSIYPNPTIDYIFVKSVDLEVDIQHVEVVDLQGQLIKRLSYSPQQKIKVEAFAPGVYFLLFRGSEEELLGRTKFIKLGMIKA